MADRCILALTPTTGFSQTLGGPPSPVMARTIHQKILPRYWKCQSCASSTLCNAYQLHFNPLVSTVYLGQPALPPGASSSHSESPSSESDYDIPNDKTWKPPKRSDSQKPKKAGPPKVSSNCHFCKKPMTLSCNLLDNFLNPISSLSGQNLIPDRFIPAGLQCCTCERPYFLSLDKQDRSSFHHLNTRNPPGNKSHITYQSSDPRDARPPCSHCLHPPSQDPVHIHQRPIQASCHGNCWVISAYGERLARVKDLFTANSLIWLLPSSPANASASASAGNQSQPKTGLLHQHQRLCESYVKECSSAVTREIARKAGVLVGSRASATGGYGRRVHRQMAAAEERLIKAQKNLTEAETRRDEVVKKIEEARLWVMGVLDGRRLSYEQAGGLDDDGSDGADGDDGDAQMDDFPGTVQDHEGDVDMDTAGGGEGEEEDHQQAGENKEINWRDQPVPEPDESYVRYCEIKGIPLYESRPRRRR
ncbi:hypothetical protein QBC41DRAFT_381562, partial [Cercophora samala]